MIRARFWGRVSGDFDDDEGFRNLTNLVAAGYRISILLCGRLFVDPVTTADPNEGFIIVQNGLLRRRFEGSVEIVIEKPKPPRRPGDPWQWWATG